MSALASRITGVSIVCSTICSGGDQRKYQNSASLACVRRIHRLLVDSPHKRPETREMFPFDDVILDFFWSIYCPPPPHLVLSYVEILCLWFSYPKGCYHYSDVIMGTMASQITSLTIVYSAVYSGAEQRKHQSSASLAFVRGIHRWPVNSPHKWPVTRKMFPFNDVIRCIHRLLSPYVYQSFSLYMCCHPGHTSAIGGGFC